MHNNPQKPRAAPLALALGCFVLSISWILILRVFELDLLGISALGLLLGVVIYGFSAHAFQRYNAYHQELEHSQERYSAFINNSSEGIWRIEFFHDLPIGLSTEEKVDWVFDHGYYAEVNNAFMAMYGPGGDEILGKPLAESLPKDENAPMIRHFFDTGMSVHEIVSKERTPDGRTVYFKSNCHGVVQDGYLVRIWGNQIDVTEQKEAEQEIERQSQLLSGAERIANIGSWTYHPSEQRFIWSDNLFKIGGVEPGTYDLTLDSVLSVFHRDDRDRWRRNLERVIDQGIAFTREIRIFRQDRKMLYLETRAEPIFDSTGRVQAVTGISRDVTQEKIAEIARQELELQVRQLQKMEAIGTLASGIAHDFNNILSATMGYADIALGELDPQHPAYGSIKEIEKANFRARDLVDQILKHGRHLEQRRESVVLAAVIREALGLLKASLPNSINVLDELASTETRVIGDASQLHQVIINLCTNACHAMPDGGTLRLGLDQIHSTSPLKVLVGQAPAGSYAHLVVADSGEGINDSIRDRIFEPFFTTKEPGKGTGLGLSTVQSIVLDHQGGIHVHSPASGGTIFDIYLPLWEHDDAEEQAEGPLTPVGHRETVLLVDDEIPLMTLGEKMLHRLGYNAIALNNPHAALELFDQNPERFDLVVTDLRMPEMSGLELAQEMRQRDPQVKILITTGYSETEFYEYLENKTIQGCLIKPFNLAAMGQSIASALSGGGTTDRRDSPAESRRSNRTKTSADSAHPDTVH